MQLIAHDLGSVATTEVAESTDQNFQFKAYPFLKH